MKPSNFNTIESALDDLKQGKLVILVDDQDRENEGDLILAAEHATPEAINFMTQNGRGLVCMPMAEHIFEERLQIPPMSSQNQSKYRTGFGVSFGAAEGISTGISACDRAHTIKTAAHPNARRSDIVMPGHIFPLCAKRGGVMQRNGHTEGTVDLMRLAGLEPAGVLCEIMNPDGSMARLAELKQFAKHHQLSIVSIADLIHYRKQHEMLVSRVSESVLPIKNLGEFKVISYLNQVSQSEHIVLIKEPIEHNRPTLVRMHSRCLTGDVFASQRCDCGEQLQVAMEEISKQGGILLYLGQEGRGIGLVNKIKAYALQDAGLDTVDANLQLGFKADERDYWVAAQILKDLSINEIRLLTNNPLKVNALRDYGIGIHERVPLEVTATAQNLHYLQTKREKLGHLLTVGG